MPQHATHWERQVGDGIVYDGPCILKTLIATPGGADQYHDVYDGRDATSGTKFCRIQCKSEETRAVDLGDGVLFGRGIYINTQDTNDELTVCFVPL